jgi:hypothetical protein
MNGALFPAETGSNNDRQLYLTAAAYLGEPRDGANRFEVEGYKGTKRVIELLAVNTPEMSLRERMEYLINNRPHPYLKSISSNGILLFTVRNNKKEYFLTHKATDLERSSTHQY